VNKIYYVSDYFLTDILGGGELNDHELCSELENHDYKVIKIRSNELQINMIDKKNRYIISNFINLNQQVKDYLTNNCSYIIYEHDHKYLRSRNPALFKEYRAPREEIINEKFYRNAKKIFCQTSLHKKIIENNLKNCNIENISGNLWSLEHLDLLKKLSKKKKKDCYSVLNSKINHKNTLETVFYCQQKKYNYELISSPDYKNFLFLMSNNDKFIFLPKTPETCSRIVVEAKMMNIRVITNKRVGASHEPWFSLKGEILIDYMLNKRIEIANKIKDII
tara:strand:- start:3759 stop:4592 length:834 start_codon:yes stop_codon:yes gene_type:complete